MRRKLDDLRDRQDERCWDAALMLPGESDLRASMIRELSEYTGMTFEQIETRYASASITTAEAWEERQCEDNASVQMFYHEYSDYIFELASLDSPYRRLDSVLEILAWARVNGGRELLDYGAGLGAMALFFHAQGMDVTLADISTPLQELSRWRFERRGWPTRFIDLKQESLPQSAYDFVISFDVFEHLYHPWQHLKTLSNAIKPGGLLFIEAPFGVDRNNPLHIVTDTRVLDLAPMLGLQTENCSPYRILTASEFFVLRSGQMWGVPRLLAILVGWIRYGLKRVKNGPQLIRTGPRRP